MTAFQYGVKAFQNGITALCYDEDFNNHVLKRECVGVRWTDKGMRLALEWVKGYKSAGGKYVI